MAQTANMRALFLTLTMLCLKAMAIDVDTRSGLQDYLQRYGHAQGFGERAPLTDTEIEQGIRKFQEYFGLLVTGYLNQQTRNLMNQKRCDVEDFPVRRGRFELYPYKWSGNIDWRLNETHPNIPGSEAIRVMTESVQDWQKWMATITVTQTTNPNAVIIINYPTPDAAGNHGDAHPFQATTLAHAFYPSSNPIAGDMHYNMAFPFSSTEPPSATTYSLKHVSVHELGHALGLRHSNVTDAVMYPFASRGTAYRGLATDDILGILAAYGDCNLSPCQNGGTCTHQAATPRYRCTCPQYFTGTNCQTAATPCTLSPCLNGGTCTYNSGGRTCACPSTHTGTSCESAIPACTWNPCQNGGTCTNDATGGRTCTCLSSYRGVNCEILKTACEMIPCLNGASCINNSGGGRTCLCPSTYTGTNCQTMTACGSRPCQNGGTCILASNSAGYSCVCTTSYTGNQCQVSRCVNNPCMNGGTCVLDSSLSAGYRCRCIASYTGNMCQTDICSTNPCMNGGTCQLDLSGSLGYTCTCPNEFVGNRCQTSRNNSVNKGMKPVSVAPWWTTLAVLAVCWLFQK